jgi:plastocyanin
MNAQRLLRLILPAALTALLLFASMLPAAAATVTVAVGPNGTLSFDPATVTRGPGTTVTWQREGEGFAHNVSSATGMFRSGDPSTGPFTYSRVFSSGTYAYMCEFHGTQMSGTVRIRPRTLAAPDGLPFTVEWANGQTNTGSTFRVQYRSGDGDWRTWKSATSSFSVFGRNASPIRVVDGRQYRFRVKSMQGGDASTNSPAVGFTP